MKNIRPKRPHIATLDEVSLTRNGEDLGIEFHEPGGAHVSHHVGPDLPTLTDHEALERFNDHLREAKAIADAHPWVAVEVPDGKPQIEYSGRSDQWAPRGGVLRCLISDTEEGGPEFWVDDQRLTLQEFGRMLTTYAGWGMRLIFVPDDELTTPPTIEVREPEKDRGGR